MPASRAGLALWVLLLAACAADGGSHAAEMPAGVGRYHRPPGMPIGTGAAGGLGTTEDTRDEELPPAALEVTDNSDLAIPRFAEPPPEAAPPPPCDGCVELNVHVNDINQRDEFVLAAGGTPVTRVTWTIRVNFNSDQLAVQPFIDDARGTYTNLHVNTFPLGAPVPVEQEYQGRAHTIGLVVGSSGAWTGDQTMSVFVDSVSIEGSPSRSVPFDTDAEGFSPRTHAHDPKVVFHPKK